MAVPSVCAGNTTEIKGAGMEDRETKNSAANKEISIIDLLVVLLRFRKMIIGITAAAFCVAAIGYFIYPAYQYNRQPDLRDLESEFETVMAVGLLPGTDFFLTWPQFGSCFRKPEILIDALRKSGLELPQEEITEWLLPLNGNYKDGYKEEKIYASPNKKIQVNENLAAGMIEFTFKNGDPQEGAIFLSRLVALGGDAAEAYINAAGRAYVESFETVMGQPGFSGAENALFEKDRERYLFARSVLAGSARAFSVFFEPYTVERKPDDFKTPSDFRGAYRKRALLLVAAAFLLSCFFAFAAHEVMDIRGNEDAMEKIRGALKKPDRDHL
jgi:hypothetical protein